MAPSWRNVAVGALALSFPNSGLFASAQAASRQPAAPGYRGINAVCPSACFETGPDPFGWSVYPSFDKLSSCKQAVLSSFSLYDDVDDKEINHRVYACTAYGHDWDDAAKAEAAAARPAKNVNVTYEIGWTTSESGTEADYSLLMGQMREYVVNGHAPTNRTTMLYAQFGHNIAGLYIGQGLRGPDVANAALKALDANSAAFDGKREALAIQLCGKGFDADHVLGFMALNHGTMGDIQKAFKTWSRAECLDFSNSTSFTSTAPFTLPQLSSIKGNHTLSHSNGTVARRHHSGHGLSHSTLHHRASECSTQVVVSGDSCAALAERCGISGDDFTKYNSDEGLCSSLTPGQHVCCSSGDMPDFRPKTNDDGSCATTIVNDGQSCATVAAANSLTNDDIEDFNKDTWGWNGCKNIFAGSVICISEGTPPMPAAMENALCGPQVPGTEAPDDMSTLADLNPCPLNACCDTWGQCGITPEFCTDTNTGAPGTAANGTNGCISNCGTDVVKGSAPSEFRSVGYYEGYLFNRDCLYQDTLQIDTSKYTHLHFGFGSITADYEVSIGDEFITYEFNNFKFLSGPKKILSFGGWDFSTNPSTYNIFREGTQAANRLKLATNIANFIKEHDLDGVDIDWEYPGAPDIPGIPAGSEDEGDNYLKFLVVLKNLLKGKSVSIAAPASYWYLKGFPIKSIGKIVDYIVFMTYDLHGQWDAANPNSQDGCATGNCLRSQVNLTETMTSLAMITKAGVPSDRVVVGVASYGRSFAMAEAGCHGPECLYTGTRANSDATKGRCTGTAGYLANAEINEIISGTSSGLTTRDDVSSRVTAHYLDEDSDSNILVYDDTQWVAYMSPEVRESRVTKYKGLNMGGSVNWATDLETFEDAPVGNWSDYKAAILAKKNPLEADNLHDGNWSSLTCDNDYYKGTPYYSPSERWAALDVDEAWDDMMKAWKYYRDNVNSTSFTGYIAYMMNFEGYGDCGDIVAGCGGTIECTDDRSPAEVLIWESLNKVSTTYARYHDGLLSAAALIVDPSLKDFTKKFAPVPPDDPLKWQDLLLDLISDATPMVGGKFFKYVLTKLPGISSLSDAGKEKAQEITESVLGEAASVGTSLVDTEDPDEWSDDDQDGFMTYLGQSAGIWDRANTIGLATLFDGSDDSIDTLKTLVADGHFANGASAGGDEDGFDAKTGNETVTDAFTKAYYGFAIPAIWQSSGHHPFIIDTQRSCTSDDDGDDDDLASACYQGKLYKLADPDGKSQSCRENAQTGVKCGSDGVTYNDFATPNGVDQLKDSAWGGVTAQDIITGTYINNGNENGGDSKVDTSKNFDSLANMDITVPNFINLPVCTETVARRSWTNADDTESARNVDFFPCNIANGKDYCGESTFEDQGSEASPLIDDCKQIIKNIQGTDGEWNTSPLEKQRSLVHYGSCRFGVTGKGIHGNVSFMTGAQDIIDIINDAIEKFGRDDGRVGAKGTMQCDGNIKKQKVDWGLY
ncbi:hypothetical protein BDW74DRAFT_185756 [Aspergillus multicolor]|uniref:uncharacterized protein n=1 Tax=Aspergillus multicolor TaxID=41759 RepID=UPI003CCCE9C2